MVCRRVKARAWACLFLVLFAIAGTQPAAAQAVLSVTATGTIPSACTLALASNFPSSLDLASSGTSNATATVNCAQGFKINAQSANGAIQSSASASANFTNSLPYSLTLSVPVESGTPNPISATCASSSLSAGQSSCALSPAGAGLSSSGRASIDRTATLTIAWTLPALPTHLAAGRYSDTITLTITPGS